MLENGSVVGWSILGKTKSSRIKVGLHLYLRLKEPLFFVGSGADLCPLHNFQNCDTILADVSFTIL